MHPLHYYSQLKRLASNRSYRRLLIGGSISALGDRVGYIAFLAAVTSHSTDVFAVGGITIAEMLPTLFAAPLVSMVVDRFDRRRLMFIADIVRALLFFGAVLYPMTWVFFLTAFLSAAFTLLFEPSRQALEPHYVPKGELTQASGIRMGLMSLVMVCGPALGGILVAAFGFTIAFLVNGVSFIVSAWMVFDLEAVPIREAKSEGTLHEILGGVRAVRQSANLKFIFGLYAVFYFVIGIQFPLIYVFTAQNLHGGPAEIGWLFSGIGIGGILGGAWLASISKERNPFDAGSMRGKRWIAALVILDGFVVVLFAGMHTLIPVAMLYAVFGFIGTTLNASMQSAVATQSAEAMRGRVFALFSAMSGPLIVISIAIGTPFAREYGASTIFYISGSMEILLGAAAVVYASRARAQVLQPAV